MLEMRMTVLILNDSNFTECEKDITFITVGIGYVTTDEISFITSNLIIYMIQCLFFILKCDNDKMVEIVRRPIENVCACNKVNE